MSRELTLRIYSAIVMVAVVLAATWYGGLAFRLLAGALSMRSRARPGSFCLRRLALRRAGGAPGA